MPDVIDIHDLPNEDIQFIKKIVGLLREKAKTKETGEGKKEVVFSSHDSNVIGKITREEIYDYL